MKRSNYLILGLKKSLSLTLKTLILFIGLNIILTTIYVLIKDQIEDNSQREISSLYTKIYKKEFGKFPLGNSK